MGFFNKLIACTAIIISLYFFSIDSLAGAPAGSWAVVSTVADCTGSDNQTNARTTNCQSYDQDFYESLNPTGNGFCDSDIANYNVGVDADFHYFEWDMVGSMFFCNGSGGADTGHKYYIAIEIMVDSDGNNVSDNRPDFFFEADPDLSHVGNTWNPEFNGLIKAYFDSNDDAGGSDPLACNKSGETGCLGGSEGDGMESDLSGASNDAYLRVFDPGNGNYNPQMAIRATLIGSPGLIRTRAFVMQSSTLDKSKYLWHDHNGVSDLDGENMDSVCAVGVDCMLTTPVTLSYFKAAETGKDIHFTWSTQTEAGNAGFNIYAETETGREKVNDELIQSKVVDSLERTDYSYIADISDAEVFYISDIDILGNETFHGLFNIDEVYGSREKTDFIEWEEIQAESKSKEGLRNVLKRVNARKQASVFKSLSESQSTNTSAAPQADVSFPKAELRVDEDGIYRVTYEQLLSEGLDLGGLRTQQIALTNRGVPVPIYIYVPGGNSLGPGSYIDFYGKALNTLYTKTNVYVLQVDTGLSQLAAVDKKTVPPKSDFETSYIETNLFENNNLYSMSSPNGDPWYDVRIMATSSQVTRNFNINLDNTHGDMGSIKVSLYGLTDFPDNPDHHVIAEFNGTEIADEIFDGTTQIDIDVSKVTIQEGTNTLTVKVPNDTGVKFDIVNFDKFSVSYPRAFIAKSGKLIFDSQGDAYTVDGLDTQNVVIYSIGSDGSLTKIEGLSVGQTQNGYGVSFSGDKKSPNRYAVFNTESLLSAQIDVVPESNDIKSGYAQYLIISHPDFIDGLGDLVDEREITYSVKVVNVEDVYREFSFGIFDPVAIREYISYAVDNLGTEMVLLVGGDSYDYLNYLGNGSFSFIPTLYDKTHAVVSFTPSDSLLADVDGDKVQDVAIGRFPVRTDAELASIIQKTLQYPYANHQDTAVFAADRADRGISFTNHSNQLIAQVPGVWSVDTVYLDDSTVQDARTLLIGSINEGRAVTSFFGHSSMDRWTFSGLFNTADAQNLTNADLPTVVTQYGCWNTYFVQPNLNSLGHRFLLSGNKGAAAVLGASTLTQTSSDVILGKVIVERMMQPGTTIGEAVVDAKQQMGFNFESLKDLMLGWTILGDPALVVVE